MDMGGLDADKMYSIVMKWDWGNSNGNIYHDPETRKNSISYRSVLSRLMNKLIAEGQLDKAKKVIELSLKEMPVEKFGYYSMVEPFAKGYYDVGEKAKAQQLLEKLIGKYKENLNYYGTLSSSDQVSLAIDIITDIERYRSLLTVMKESGDVQFYNKSRPAFNTYIKMFDRFERERE
jgi:tetratricopeptide (TPR) repeat protein